MLLKCCLTNDISNLSIYCKYIAITILLSFIVNDFEYCNKIAVLIV